MAAGIAVSVALAGALAATELVAANAARPAPSQYSLVADFLNRAADTARAQHVSQPGPGQMYYTLSYATGLVVEKKNGRVLNSASCEVSWYNPAGRPVISVVWPGKEGDRQCATVPLTPPGKRFGPVASHWYPPPASLSHDPGTLLTQLDAAASRGAAYWNLQVATGPAPRRDQIAFTLVERLLQAPISGDLRAALYQATIGIPGVMLDPHATDALGRPGTGVSVRLPDGAGSAFIREFILAKNTFTFLGTRTWAGLIPIVTAQVRSGIVKADGS